MLSATPDTLPDARAHTLYAQLLEKWGSRPCDMEREVIDALVWGILSQRTNYRNQKPAYDRMFERFESWSGIMQAPTDALTEAIATSTYPERKAPTIQRFLAQLHDAQGNFDLEHLRELDVEQAYDFMTAFDGIGPKTASMTLLFYMHKPILPVDTHVSRVSRRYGLIPMKSSDARAHKLLNAMMPEGDTQAIYDFHRAGFLHGQKICTYSSPRCHTCPLREHCDYGSSSASHVRTS